MFAIRCHRLAAGAEVDGQKFSHDQWTLVEQPTDTQVTQSLPSEKWKQPLLQIVEVTGPEDPALKPFPVQGTEAEASEQKIKDENGDGVIEDIEKLSLKELAVIAEPLGIAVKPGMKKADVIAAIWAEWHEEELEKEAREKAIAEKTKEQENDLASS